MGSKYPVLPPDEIIKVLVKMDSIKFHKKEAIQNIERMGIQIET